MPAIWTAPRTWVDGEIVDATILNQHVRDNLMWLKTPASARVAPAGNVATTSTTPVDVTGLTLTFTTNGGSVLLGFTGDYQHNTLAGFVYNRFTINGVGTATLSAQQPPRGSENNVRPVMLWIAAGLAAGSHTFRVQHWTNTGTATLNGSLGNPLFFGVEVGWS